MLLEMKVPTREEAKEALLRLHHYFSCTELCEKLMVEKINCSAFECEGDSSGIGCCMVCMRDGDEDTYLTCERGWCPTAKELMEKCLLK